FGISNTPTSVSNLSQVSAISGGAAHSLAVKADGSAWAWGDNDRGQLGNGTSIISNVPVAVSGLTQLSAVAAGGAHSLAVKKDGTVWAWGDNHLGQLGLGTLGGDQLTPVQITSLAGVKAVTAGLGHSVALKTDGTVYTWGDNHTGQLGRGTLGRGTSGGASATPGQVIGLSNVTAIASFGAHTLALKADGTVWAWGDNHLGQLGHGTAGGNSPLPVQVTGLSNITKIVTGLALGAGGIHSLALKSDGTAWAWGNNFTGQLGTGSFTSSPVPVQVNGLTGGLFIAGGGAHSLAVVTSSSP
ncbi:MAG: RCC1 repeat-containing protein, partial [Nitrospirae bacterium]